MSDMNHGTDGVVEHCGVAPRWIEVSVRAYSGLLLAVTFEDLQPTLLVLDDEKLALINRALGLAGACVDHVALEQSRKEGGV